MRFLILNYDYEQFLGWLYDTHDGLASASFDRQQAVRAEAKFGGVVFYAEQLRALGHDVQVIYPNNERMQRQWAREFGSGPGSDTDDEVVDPALSIRLLRRGADAVSGTPFAGVKPIAKSLLGIDSVRPAWFHDVLSAQFEHYHPDVVINRMVGNVGTDFLAAHDHCYDLLVGDVGTEPPCDGVTVYDVILALLPSVVDDVAARGVDAYEFRRGFGASVLDSIDADGKTVPVSFVGSLSARHTGRIRVLERVAAQHPLSIWGVGLENLPADSPLHDCHRGPAWGLEMYDVLARSEVTLNRHIDLAGDVAANHRLYEATGVGTCLVTDWKSNLQDLFAVDEEVVAYGSPAECVDAVGTLLNQPEQRRDIATAGQERTLADHTYEQRMRRLERICADHLPE
jgi:hypothetical protein